MGEYSLDDNTVGEVLKTCRIKIFVCNDADKLALNHVTTFFLRKYFLLD